MAKALVRPCRHINRTSHFTLSIIRIFQVFDKSGYGYICASDIRAILQCMGEDLTEDESMNVCFFKGMNTLLRATTRQILFAFREEVISKIDPFLSRDVGGG